MISRLDKSKKIAVNQIKEWIKANVETPITKFLYSDLLL